MKAINEIPISSCVFYGDYTGDGKKDAIVFIYYSYKDGGNMVSVDVSKLRYESGGYRNDGKVDDVYGQDPRDARFRPGEITIVTTTPGPDDPRCCPSEATKWSIKIR